MIESDSWAALQATMKMASSTPAMSALGAEIGIRTPSCKAYFHVAHIRGLLNVDCDALSRLSCGYEVPENLLGAHRTEAPPRRGSFFLAWPRRMDGIALHEQHVFRGMAAGVACCVASPGVLCSCFNCHLAWLLAAPVVWLRRTGLSGQAPFLLRSPDLAQAPHVESDSHSHVICCNAGQRPSVAAVKTGQAFGSRSIAIAAKHASWIYNSFHLPHLAVADVMGLLLVVPDACV